MDKSANFGTQVIHDVLNDIRRGVLKTHPHSGNYSWNNKMAASKAFVWCTNSIHTLIGVLTNLIHCLKCLVRKYLNKMIQLSEKVLKTATY